MKLLLRRDQKSGLLGGAPKFILYARAELTDDEATSLKKYKAGKTVLYQKMEMTDRGSGLLGLASRLAFNAMNITVTVDDLVSGKQVECKDILEMVAVEQQIREACENFKSVLEAAATFGGEEVVEYA